MIMTLAQIEKLVRRISEVLDQPALETQAAKLAQDGEPAMTTFTIDWLAGLFGSDLKRAVERTHATRWTKEPWVLGAFSAASPGGQGARKALSDTLGGNLWFADEAVQETLWCTVAGAWDAGDNGTYLKARPRLVPGTSRKLLHPQADFVPFPV